MAVSLKRRNTMFEFIGGKRLRRDPHGGGARSRQCNEPVAAAGAIASPHTAATAATTNVIRMPTRYDGGICKAADTFARRHRQNLDADPVIAHSSVCSAPVQTSYFRTVQPAALNSASSCSYSHSHASYGGGTNSTPRRRTFCSEQQRLRLLKDRRSSAGQPLSVVRPPLMLNLRGQDEWEHTSPASSSSAASNVSSSGQLNLADDAASTSSGPSRTGFMKQCRSVRQQLYSRVRQLRRTGSLGRQPRQRRLRQPCQSTSSGQSVNSTPTPVLPTTPMPPPSLFYSNAAEKPVAPASSSSMSSSPSVAAAANQKPCQENILGVGNLRSENIIRAGNLRRLKFGCRKLAVDPVRASPTAQATLAFAAPTQPSFPASQAAAATTRAEPAPVTRSRLRTNGSFQHCNSSSGGCLVPATFLTLPLIPFWDSPGLQNGGIPAESKIPVSPAAQQITAAAAAAPRKVDADSSAMILRADQPLHHLISQARRELQQERLGRAATPTPPMQQPQRRLLEIYTSSVEHESPDNNANTSCRTGENNVYMDMMFNSQKYKADYICMDTL